MKVALLGPFAGTHSGYSRVVECMTPLIAKYVDTTLYLPIDSPKFKNYVDNFNVSYILPPIYRHPLHFKSCKYLLNTLKCIRKEGFDVIQSLIAWPLSFVGALAQVLTGSSLFVGAHGTDVFEPLFNWKTRHSLYLSLKRATKVLAISSYTKNELVHNLNLKNVIVQPLDGVDYEFFSRKRDISDLEKRWRPGRVLLTVGKLKERKGIDVSIKAFKIVKENIPDAKYIIIGGGREDKYRSLVKELKLNDVYFIGEIEESELVKYYQLCDVFVLTPRRYHGDVEGFGLVYLEAGAAGKPVVASNSGGVSDVVKHMVNGILVSENDPYATAQAIIQLLKDDNLAAELGNNGKKVAKLFCWENTVKSLIDVWQKTLRHE
jgi:phosphatidylinositol alpha-1,6-mannosyltransferase